MTLAIIIALHGNRAGEYATMGSATLKLLLAEEYVGLKSDASYFRRN
jgi:hypothetical protein